MSPQTPLPATLLHFLCTQPRWKGMSVCMCVCKLLREKSEVRLTGKPPPGLLFRKMPGSHPVFLNPEDRPSQRRMTVTRLIQPKPTSTRHTICKRDTFLNSWKIGKEKPPLFHHGNRSGIFLPVSSLM